MKSIIDLLATEKLPRIRVGIGKPENKNDMINYVIGKINKDEQELLQPGIKKAKEAVEIILNNGIDNAMNKFNKK